MSKLQECMATSTTEVEYVVASNATKEALCLSRLAFTFWQVHPNSAPVVFNDSQGAVALANNPVHHNASKHIEVRCHFIRDSVTKGKLGLETISTVENVENRMTKSLLADRFRSRRQLMGVIVASAQSTRA